MSKKVAVAIPTYNRIDYLKESLQSVLNQTFQDFSVYIFDNASTEPVEDEVKKFADPRIQFVGNAENVGAEGNINRALNYPFQEDYLIIFHDDDTMHPKLLENEVAVLDTHSQAAFVVCNLQRGVDGTMQNFAEIQKDAEPVVYQNGFEFIRAQMNWLRYGFPAVLYRVKAIGQTRVQPEFFHFFDMVFLANMAKNGGCAFLPEPLMIHRIHSGQYTESRKREYEQGSIKMLQFFKEQLPQPLSKSDIKLLQKYSVNSLLRACSHIGSGLPSCMRFLQECKKQNVFSFAYVRFMDARGLISLVSVVFGSRKIIDIARWIKPS